jgi:crotonobetaine/carnitine-CoA ligase
MTTPQTIPEVIQHNARLYGARQWAHFILGDRRLSFQDVETLSQRAAGGFQRAGIVKGDRVAVMLDNVAEFVLAWFGLVRCGAVMVPLNTYFKPAECGFILNHAGVKGVVCAPAHVETLSQAAAPGVVLWRSDGGAFSAFLDGEAAAAVDVGSDDPAGILYTSGTTGSPKGCVESHRFYLRAGGSFRDIVGVESSDVILTPLPLFHANPQIIAVMGSLMAGSGLVVVDRFHPTSFIRTCRETGATVICYLGVMPAMLMNLPPSPEDSRHSVRIGLGAAIPPGLHAAFESRFGIPMVEAYGMTEVGNATMVRPGEERLVGSGTSGRLCPDVQARLVDEAGRDVETGQSGELWLRGPSLFSGYFRDEDANRVAFEDGWFRTGDMLRADGEGNFYFIDRLRDVIRRSGVNISAAEVEAVLRMHPSIADVAVIGVPDDIRGQEVQACLVLKSGFSRNASLLSELVDLAAENLAYFKVPRFYAFYTSFPKTPTLKTRKFEIRKGAADASVTCWDRTTETWRT